MRRIGFFLLCTTVLAAAVFDCVGNDGPPATGADAGTDSGSTGTDSGTSNDSSIADSGSTVDANDAGLVDQCIGHTDCPNDIESTSLGIWLRADVGVTCNGGRVSAWADQSGHANDAHPGKHDDTTPALAPKCGVDTIGGRPAFTFTAPTEPDGGDAGEFTQYVDETMETNLDFIYNTNYTVFVVHRRAVDAEFGLLGQDNTYEPPATQACFFMGGVEGPQDALMLEYSGLAAGGTTFGFSQGCGSSAGTTDSFKAGTAQIGEVVYSSTTGHITYENGQILIQGNGGPGDKDGIGNDSTRAGVIGRGFSRYGEDKRYQGNIAEIIGYSINLTDTERTQIEAYLKRQWSISF